jgi:hypothetical protein
MYVFRSSTPLSPLYLRASKKESFVATSKMRLHAMVLKSSRAVMTQAHSRGVMMEFGSLMLVKILASQTNVLMTRMELDFAMDLK